MNPCPLKRFRYGRGGGKGGDREDKEDEEEDEEEEDEEEEEEEGGSEDEGMNPITHSLIPEP